MSAYSEFKKDATFPNDGKVTVTGGATSAGVIKPLLVDSSGIQSVAIASGSSAGTEYAEDTVHVSGDMVTMAGVVRKDTAIALSDLDGDRTVLITDAEGKLHTAAAGAVAHDAVNSGKPLLTGGEARTTDLVAVQDGDRVKFIGDKLGRQIVTPYTQAATAWRAPAVSHSSLTAADIKAAPGAGLSLFVTSVQISNTHATTTVRAELKDSNGSIDLMLPMIKAGETFVASFPVPIQISANNSLQIAVNDATVTVRASAQGFTAVA